jgi:hypothetical protein
MSHLPQVRPRCIRRALSDALAWQRLQGTALLLAFTVPTVAGAQAPPCHEILCAPSLQFWTVINHSHLFGGPRVETLPGGAVQDLTPANNLQLEFLTLFPTYVPNLSAFVSASWLPSATAGANPYTEYTASTLGGPVRSPGLSLGMGVTYNVVTPQETGGWLTLSPYLGDLFSPAQRPDDRSSYTHKLDLGAVATVHAFAWEPKKAWVHGLGVIIQYDYRATGLPQKGDIVPAGQRLFLTDARPSTLIAGLSIPIAPLHAKP